MSDAVAAVDLDEEDHWRAGLYALIGRLFFEGPDAALLAQLSADTDGDDYVARSGVAATGCRQCIGRGCGVAA